MKSHEQARRLVAFSKCKKTRRAEWWGGFFAVLFVGLFFIANATANVPLISLAFQIPAYASALVSLFIWGWRLVASFSLSFLLIAIVSVGTASPIQSKPVIPFPPSDEKFHENFARWLSENNGLPDAIQWNMEQL